MMTRREIALNIVRRLREAGHVAYFAGGCVRDELLGLTPSDFDVATDAVPDVVRQVFGNRKTQAVGAAFGVILVHDAGCAIEVATFRTDLDYVDGRRPSGVVFSGAEADAKRRDFTVNGLFCDPLAQEADPSDDGIIDFVDGKRDLRDGVLRAIGSANKRFDEDYLRLLRAVRFAARFDLTIEPETWEAIVRHAPRLTIISPERVGEELRKMLSPPTRVAAWGLLRRSGLLKVVLRHLPESGGWPHVVHYGGESLFPHLAPGRPVGFGTALAAMSLDWQLSQPGHPSVLELLVPARVEEAIEACRAATRFSNEEASEMRGALSLREMLAPDLPPPVARMKRFLAADATGGARQLMAAIREADESLQPRVDWLFDLFDAMEDVAPPPLVTGDDLIAAGMAPGPSFKRVLDAVYDAQLEGRVTTREQALALATR